MLQLQQHQSELERLGIAVLVVTFEQESMARRYVEDTGCPWPVLIDSSRQLYAEYGMHRGDWWRILGPASWGDYIKLLRSGRKLRRPTDDIYQLGGDVLICPHGVVRLHHVSETPVDRPSVDSILEVVRKAGNTP